ncbi:MAG: hypothetical protein O3A87_01910 [Verrucomicrobia bacterium]|nr:hypothetical protein [Verrucomicrobiota bacterium]
MMIGRCVAILGLWVGSSLVAVGQYFNDFESPPHHYGRAALGDPMTRFLAEVENGTRTLPEEVGLPLVKDLLEALKLDAASQVLVFSKTSLQKSEISPGNPRALYFNEEVYLGWMPGGRIELASFDPELGPVFYFQRPLQDEEGKPFVQTRSCLGCHAGNATNFLPGSLSRSVYPDERGRTMDSVMDERMTGHGVPFAQRWGGWYVTGESGALKHVGNRVAEQGAAGVQFKAAPVEDPKSLERFFPVAEYAAPGSDVVALLVFDHQITMHQRLVEAGYRTRQALHDNGLEADEVDREKLTAKSSRKEFEEGLEMVVDYLLFRGEVPLAKGVQGSGEFEKVFAQGRKAARDGTSLRDFRLEGRIFERRCSYMIYSPTFERLPAMLKEAVYGRLLEILSAEEGPEGFEYLEAEERKGILRETKKDLPAAWRVEG